MKRKTLLFLLFAFTCSSVFAQVNITFELNSATLQNIDPAGLFLAGGSGFGTPGDNQLLDPDNDGIYTITIQKSVGFSSHYTFLNGNCGDWSCKENLAGLPCSDPANYNDRFLPAVTSDTTIKACFGTCDSDGSCTIVTDSVDITFELNTSSIEVDAGGIFIAGGGNFGNPGDNPMIDPEGDGVYTFSVRRPKGFASHYTFTNGNCGDWSCKEDISGLECADGQYNDRWLSRVTSDTTIKACFAQCTTDGSCGTNSLDKMKNNQNLFSIKPTLVHNYVDVTYSKNLNMAEVEMTVLNSAGQLMTFSREEATATSRLNTTSYPAGIYFITVKTTSSILTRKFVVQK